MNTNNNDMLIALSRVWKWDGDWMTCRACKRHLIASRDGEPFVHADGCAHRDFVHPWQALRDVLTIQSGSAQAATAVGAESTAALSRDVMRDAERYRWLRTRPYIDVASCWLVEGDVGTADQFDAAIDAEMRPVCVFENCDQAPTVGPYCRAHYNEERGWPDSTPGEKAP